jgi:hypothetical protein
LLEPSRRSESAAVAIVWQKVARALVETGSRGLVSSGRVLGALTQGRLTGGVLPVLREGLREGGCGSTSYLNWYSLSE